ncbi:hypothetical protein AVEN_128143-1 [Araneus ventricosus]|uniref:Uncharacterized protein n=1 Tax=Araneus ventricosus TaxID=182803 RepID=A0A4Y1ZZL9_ARAVE|nr:hypothetical protein AVEN_128143-1 [Araneus ventricosus]
MKHHKNYFGRHLVILGRAQMTKTTPEQTPTLQTYGKRFTLHGRFNLHNADMDFWWNRVLNLETPEAETLQTRKLELLEAFHPQQHI